MSSELSLNQSFAELNGTVVQLRALLHQAGERYWVIMLDRALKGLRKHHLSGATALLGCYTGSGSLSDLDLATTAPQPERYTVPLAGHPLQQQEQQEFDRLRSAAFDQANTLASRCAGGQWK